MIDRIRRKLAQIQEEEGVSVPLVALSMVVLLGVAAFAVDLGWFYVNAAQVQRAADAGALAGVIHMPQRFDLADSSAKAMAASNGYTDGVDNAAVTVGTVPTRPDQIEVTVTDTVGTYFLGVFGIDTQTISRKATAEYVPPLKLGSPDNQFGNTCKPGSPGCSGSQPFFWANIMGKYTPRSYGDAYSPYCTNKPGNSSCNQNTLFRSRGYLYGIEKGSNAGFSIEFLDMAHHNISGGNNTGDQIRTGDRGCEQWGTSSSDCGQTVTVNLYEPDPTPLDISDNNLICSHTWSPQPQVPENDPYVWESGAGCFSVGAAQSGIYVLQVKVENPSEPKYSGLNRYALRVNSGSRLYGIGDFSIYNNTQGTSTFNIAEVGDIYAGRTFVVELFDPGESSKVGYLKLIDPRDGQPYDSGGCRLYSKQATGTWALDTTANPCVETVTPSEYQDRWLKFEVDIPADYTCGGSCWWKVNYQYTSSVNDTTTWRAYVIGNPVHLVPNG